MSEHENVISRETEHSPLETYELRIAEDRSPESPREWDNLGHLVTWHRRYDWTDKDVDADELSGPAEVRALIHREGGVLLPVYLLDHGNLTLSTAPFGDKFDLGLVGVIFATGEDIEREYGKLDDDAKAKAAETLRGEIQALNQYINNEVYEYFIEDTRTGAIVDACGGVYEFTYCQRLARESMDRIIEEDKAGMRKAMNGEFAAAGVTPDDVKSYEIVPLRYVRPAVGGVPAITETPGDLSDSENILRWNIYLKTDRDTGVFVDDADTREQAETSVSWRTTLLKEMQDGQEESCSPGM